MFYFPLVSRLVLIGALMHKKMVRFLPYGQREKLVRLPSVRIVGNLVASGDGFLKSIRRDLP